MSTVLVLRSVDKDRKAHGGFQWPESGPAEAADWSPRAECGQGLHGWLKGEGDATASSFSWTAPDFASRLWQVVEVEEDEIVALDGEVKFPRGNVLFTGSQLEATSRIQAAYPTAAVIGATVTAGDSGQATAGNCGQATAGDSGQATAGNCGQATAGDSGQATAGNCGQATAGDSGQATAGNYGQATAGDSGQATAGYAGKATAGNYGQATAGNYGQATAGYAGKATAGNYGQATAGNYGQATAGEKGTLILSYWDEEKGRQRLVVGYPGEDGIEAGKTYKLNAKHEFVEVES